jgi:chromate transport protein ChrA
MDAETLVWTLVFFGSTVIILAGLIFWAWKMDRQEKAELAAKSEDD